MKTPIKATLSNIVIRPCKKKKRPGAVIVPHEDEISDFCCVVSIGPDVQHLKVGSIVLRPDRADVEWVDEEDNDELYLICDESSIVATR